MKKIHTILLLFVLFIEPAVAEEPLLVSKLGEGERLEVEFSSSGCFHNYSFRLTFSPGEVVIRDRISKRADSKKTQKYKDRVEILKLSKRDLKRLDRLFKYYADKPGGGCTTVDQISVNKFKGGSLVFKKEYIDGSCASDDVIGVLTFWELRSRLDKKQK